MSDTDFLGIDFKQLDDLFEGMDEIFEGINEAFDGIGDLFDFDELEL